MDQAQTSDDALLTHSTPNRSKPRSWLNKNLS